ncbi:MAG: response regulator transcription factor, partial [Pseudomonadota bacterium]
MQAKPRTSVFIIDDNEMTRTVLRMIVQGEQYHVIGEASSGVAGLERALRLKPDLVCLDIQMPDADGLDVLLTLRARLPDTLVLMVTAQNDHQTVQRALGM